MYLSINTVLLIYLLILFYHFISSCLFINSHTQLPVFWFGEAVSQMTPATVMSVRVAAHGTSCPRSSEGALLVQSDLWCHRHPPYSISAQPTLPSFLSHSSWKCCKTSPSPQHRHKVASPSGLPAKSLCCSAGIPSLSWMVASPVSTVSEGSVPSVMTPCKGLYENLGGCFIAVGGLKSYYFLRQKICVCYAYVISLEFTMWLRLGSNS